ncbi:hypothetical protein FF38_08513 [Lucilia cuprina]|uniref:Uncharacterized protein n=1 Tax=Lucilia cuprina TaxID=7375 RepID=A0A0L0CCH7_LUCCU|nr:hypothetical protein FF38_08513 [Lucilia cuprina]
MVTGICRYKNLNTVLSTESSNSCVPYSSSIPEVEITKFAPVGVPTISKGGLLNQKLFSNDRKMSTRTKVLVENYSLRQKVRSSCAKVLNAPLDSRTFWTFVKRVKYIASSSVPTLIKNNKTSIDPIDKSNLLAELFAVPDCTPALVLKQCSSKLARPLAHLFSTLYQGLKTAFGVVASVLHLVASLAPWTFGIGVDSVRIDSCKIFQSLSASIHILP